MIKTSYTYKNSTNDYQLVGNYQDVIFQGSEQECVCKMEHTDVDNSKWGVIQVVAPGEVISGDLVKYDPNEPKTESAKECDEMFANWLKEIK